MCHPPPDQIMSTATAAWNWKYRRSGDSVIRLYHSFLHGVLARLIAPRHVLENVDHLLSEAVGTENDDLTTVPQQFLLEVTRGTDIEFVVGIGTVGGIADLGLAPVDRHLFDVVVLGIEGTDAYLSWWQILLANNAKTTLVEVVRAQ